MHARDLAADAAQAAPVTFGAEAAAVDHDAGRQRVERGILDARVPVRVDATLGKARRDTGQQLPVVELAFVRQQETLLGSGRERRFRGQQRRARQRLQSALEQGSRRIDAQPAREQCRFRTVGRVPDTSVPLR